MVSARIWQWRIVDVKLLGLLLLGVSTGREDKGVSQVPKMQGN